MRSLGRHLVMIAAALMSLRVAAPGAGEQSRAERRTAELESRITSEPDVLVHYIDLARHQSDNRWFLDARATVVRAINRLAAAAALSPSVWRAPSLTGKEPAPLRVGKSVPPPRKIKDVKPIYPPEAQSDRASGRVTLDVVIGARGTVEELQVRRSDHPALEAAAMAAVRQWLYEPVIVDGTAVRITMPVVLTFSIQTAKPAPDAPLVDAIRRRPDDLGAWFRLARYYAERDRRADLMPALLGWRDALGKRVAG